MASDPYIFLRVHFMQFKIMFMNVNEVPRARSVTFETSTSHRRATSDPAQFIILVSIKKSSMFVRRHSAHHRSVRVASL